jgi:hypothetical protein
VLKFRSVNSIVIAPAKTGRESKSKIVVIITDQTNKGTCSIFISFGRMFIIVVIKLIDPRIEDTPAKCKEKIAKSTALPLCEMFPARGGYTVQPVPAPASTMEDLSNKIKEGGSSQNLILFIRGNAISGAEIIKGVSQFPKPPIKAGITIKKIITKA